MGRKLSAPVKLRSRCQRQRRILKIPSIMKSIKILSTVSRFCWSTVCVSSFWARDYCHISSTGIEYPPLSPIRYRSCPVSPSQCHYDCTDGCSSNDKTVNVEYAVYAVTFNEGWQLYLTVTSAPGKDPDLWLSIGAELRRCSGPVTRRCPADCVTTNKSSPNIILAVHMISPDG